MSSIDKAPLFCECSKPEHFSSWVHTAECQNEVMFVVACIGLVLICLFIRGPAENVEILANEYYLSGMLADLVSGKTSDPSQKKE